MRIPINEQRMRNSLLDIMISTQKEENIPLQKIEKLHIFWFGRRRKPEAEKARLSTKNQESATSILMP